MRLGSPPGSISITYSQASLDHGLIQPRVPGMTTTQIPGQATMAVRPRRPFPRRLFDDLSRSEHLAVLELLHMAMHADQAEQVRGLFLRFQECFSFTSGMGGLIRLGPNRTFDRFHSVVNVGYPDDWLKLYCHHGWAERDPILKTTLRTPRTYHWREVCQRLASKQERDLVTVARRFGLHDGITTGSVDQDNRLLAFCSFATDQELDAKRFIPLVQYLGYYMLQAVRRTAPPIAPPIYRSIQTLSSRELTVLLWITTGKTNREIGTILGVRERTIRFHVENIFAKLDVMSRAQAIAVALEEGLPDLGGIAAVK